MNGIDVRDMIAKMTEEELKDLVIHGWWTTEEVEARMEILADDWDVSHITQDDKRHILHDAIDEAGGERNEDIVEAIDGLIMGMCERRDA